MSLKVFLHLGADRPARRVCVWRGRGVRAITSSGKGRWAVLAACLSLPLPRMNASVGEKGGLHFIALIVITLLSYATHGDCLLKADVLVCTWWIVCIKGYFGIYFPLCS
ncbi:hypothetical protein E2C01_094552 [Portunus trituberculatus]|uniref:Uncharacterized protein n=1 Tax=Portunus trituberculatus TaxID=210409 RepID=A0A5B7JXX9_PORTR|nr:hypothetical protein [Portunus trituberculatus]